MQPSLWDPHAPGVCSGRSRSPRGFLLFFLIDISSASSSTKFMYSSNPCQVGSSSAQAQRHARPLSPAVKGWQLTMIRPSIRMSVFSNSQICTRVFCDAGVGTG